MGFLTEERQSELKKLVQERSNLSEDFLDTHPPYLWRAEISNNLLDSHFTRMSEKTLRNYAEDAGRGVAFLRSHNWHELPVGYSLSGDFIEEDGRKRVVADFYTIAGLQDTDDLIARMKTGLVRDVSVGFHGGEMSCDICHEDFWQCRHFPGLKYELKEGGVTRNVIATYTIDDARLSETSGVFDGSTPEAMIIKAQRHASMGLLEEKQVDLLERTYRTRLPARKSFSVKEEVKMEDKVLEQIRTTLAGPLSEEYTRGLTEEQIPKAIEAVVAWAKTLEPQAAEGRQYRKDEIARAIAEGVRAHGNEFEVEDYTALLNLAPLATIQRMARDWQKVANAALSAGRSSVETDQTPVKKMVEDFTPDEAYA